MKDHPLMIPLYIITGILYSVLYCFFLMLQIIWVLTKMIGCRLAKKTKHLFSHNKKGFAQIHG